MRDSPQQAWRTNIQGTRHVAAAVARLGAKHVFFSSEYVFVGVYPGSDGATVDYMLTVFDEFMATRSAVAKEGPRVSAG